jgi:hypothetical protein
LFICSASANASGATNDGVSGPANDGASASDTSGVRPPIGRGRGGGQVQRIRL